MKRDKLKPILFSIIKRSGPGELCAQFARDIVAGIVVTVVALPLSIALAIASGVGPEQGLYTAIVAGFVIALFGGIPATGAIARTVANVKSGGRTPVAGMVHAVVLLLVLVFLMPYAALIPMPTIAAILLQVAYNMSGWRNVLHVCRTASRGAVAVMLVTLGLTVAFDLVTAIGVGMLITMVLLMKMLSEETEVRGWRYFGDMDSEVTHIRKLPRSVRVYEINGPMFFGMTDRLMDISVKGFSPLPHHPDARRAVAGLLRHEGARGPVRGLRRARGAAHHLPCERAAAAHDGACRLRGPRGARAFPREHRRRDRAPRELLGE